MAITTTLTRMLDIQHPVRSTACWHGPNIDPAWPSPLPHLTLGVLRVNSGVAYIAAMLKEMLTELQSSLRESRLYHSATIVERVARKSFGFR